MPDAAPELDPVSLESLLQAGVVALDLRPLPLFARGHIPGAVNLPYVRTTFVDFAMELMEPGRVALIGDIPALSDMAREDLEVNGFDVAGILLGGTRAWQESGRPLERLDEVDARGLFNLQKGNASHLRVIDVREPHEVRQGVIPGSRHIPLGALPSELGQMDKGDDHILVCTTGARSLAAQAYMHRLGFKKVKNLSGGIAGWMAAGFPLEFWPPASLSTDSR